MATVDPFIISALSPLATAILSALAWAAWRSFKNLLTENKTLVTKMDAKLDAVVEHQRLHDEADLAQFANHSSRLSKAEGALEVLVQILASKEGKALDHP